MSISISDQVAQTLIDNIRVGNYQSNERLPSETELCTEFQVSRATIRTSLAQLVAQGLLIKKPGIGTFVTNAALDRLETGLHRLESVVNMARKHNLQTVVKDLDIQVIKASRYMAECLQITPNAPITRVQRTLVVDAEPISMQIDYVPLKFLEPSKLAQGFEGSVLDWLLKHNPALCIKTAITEVTAVCATKDLSENLLIPRNSALILQKETILDIDGKSVGYSDNYFVPTRFLFRISRQIESEC